MSRKISVERPTVYTVLYPRSFLISFSGLSPSDGFRWAWLDSCAQLWAILVAKGARFPNGSAVEWGLGLILDYRRPSKANGRILRLACLHNANMEAIKSPKLIQVQRVQNIVNQEF